MAELYFQMYRVCSRCLGTGTDPNGTSPATCAPCAGSGKVVHGWINLADIDDKLNDILDKCNDILEEVKGP